MAWLLTFIGCHTIFRCTWLYVPDLSEMSFLCTSDPSNAVKAEVIGPPQAS